MSTEQEVFTFEDVVIFLQDYPESNRLTSEAEFDQERIGKAVAYTINRFNDMSPPSYKFEGNPSQFPFKTILLKGTAAWLLRSEGIKKSRNRLPHSTGGTSVDDQNMAPVYMEIGQLLNREFEEEARAKKIEINVDLAWGSIPSEYLYGQFDRYRRF